MTLPDYPSPKWNVVNYQYQRCGDWEHILRTATNPRPTVGNFPDSPQRPGSVTRVGLAPTCPPQGRVCKAPAGPDPHSGNQPLAAPPVAPPAAW